MEAMRISYIHTVHLPYRFGQHSPNYFRATHNDYLSSYFTALSLATIWINSTQLMLRTFCLHLTQIHVHDPQD